jgi:hypothetical protein
MRWTRKSSFIEEATQEYIAKGLSPDKARRQARKDFGAAHSVKEAIRDTLPLRCFADFTRDLRFIVRGLCRDRMFAIAAITMLTLAIG